MKYEDFYKSNTSAKNVYGLLKANIPTLETNEQISEAAHQQALAHSNLAVAFEIAKLREVLTDQIKRNG